MNRLTRRLGIATLGLASILSNSHAQDQPKERVVEASADLRYSVEPAGLSSQNLFDFKLYPDSKNPFDIKALVGTAPGGVYDAGLEVRNNDLRINLGGVHTPDYNQGHVTGIAYLNDSGNSFIGGTAQFTPSGDIVGVGVAGWEISPDLTLEGTVDTKGNARLVGITNLFDGKFAAHVGRSTDNDYDVGASFNNEHFLANLRFGEGRNLDAQVVLGQVPKLWSKYWASVTGSGVNDLSDSFYDTDHTFKFDIGKDVVFDYFGPQSLFLGENAGDWSVEARLKENNFLRLRAGYRLPDFLVFDKPYVAGGVDFGLDNYSFSGDNTYFLQAGSRIKDTPMEFGVRGNLNSDGEAQVGLFLGFKF